MPIVFICCDFDSPNQEINCPYNSENCKKKILNLIDKGHFILLSTDNFTYQSSHVKSKIKKDLHLFESYLFEFINNFTVSDSEQQLRQ